MSQVLETVLSTFQKLSDEYGKLFIPEPRDEAIVNSMISFYEKNYSIVLLLNAMKYYIEFSEEEMVRVYDFALVQGKYRERAEEAEADREEIAKLMRHTKEQMENLT